MDISAVESQAKAVNAAMPSLMVFMEKWYESLKAAALATSSFSNLIEQLSKEHNMALAVWEGEGGAL